MLESVLNSNKLKEVTEDLAGGFYTCVMNMLFNYFFKLKGRLNKDDVTTIRKRKMIITSQKLLEFKKEELDVFVICPACSQPWNLNKSPIVYDILKLNPKNNTSSLHPDCKLWFQALPLCTSLRIVSRDHSNQDEINKAHSISSLITYTLAHVLKTHIDKVNDEFGPLYSKDDLKNGFNKLLKN